MKGRKWNAVLLGFVIVAGNGFSDLVVPDWDGDAGSTSVYFSFPTADNPPVPDTVSNLFGAIQTGLVLGSASGGWADPSVPWMVHRGDGTGAWNINPPDGSLSIDVPFSDEGLDSYEVRLMIDVVAFVDITKLPEIAVSGSVMESGVYDMLEDPGFNLGEWRQMVWTGTVEVVSSDSLTVNVNGAASVGSQIDRVAVFTQVVPEPAAISLIVLASGILLAIKRRMECNG